MEPLIIIVTLTVVMLAVGVLTRKPDRPPSALPPSRNINSEKENWERLRRARQRQAALQRLARLYQALERCLSQLRAAPDFRRAALMAKQARQVPPAWRQRLFSRFRPLLVAHLAARLQAGVPRAQATAGLVELVVALGVARFEAEYIVAEASSRVTVRRAPALSFAEAMGGTHAAHQERLQAIRALPDLDPEIREQLLEVEQERFRNVLLSEADRRS